MENIFVDYQSGKTDAFSTLCHLVSWLRPADPEDQDESIKNIRALSFLLEHHAEYRDIARTVILTMLQQSYQIPLFTEQGILTNQGFFSNLRSRIGERLLPLPPNVHSLRYLFGQIFNRRTDAQWLSNITPEVWLEFWDAFDWDEFDTTKALSHCHQQLLESVLFLSARIAAIGVEPDLVRLYPSMEGRESPFLHLNAEIYDFVVNYRNALIDGTQPAQDEKQILVLLEQCTEILNKVRKNVVKYGVSVNLTYMGIRLEQHITRVQNLLALLSYDETVSKQTVLFDLLVELVKAEGRKYSVRDLFKSNTELIALRITEHTGRHGEHYIAEDKKEWISIAKAAMGAGFIVGFMALIKLLLASDHLPILLEGLVFGLNYAIGFMIIHVLGFTVATKQPAMTAAKIAAELQEQGLNKKQGSSNHNLNPLADLMMKVLRTQFIAIFGNIILAVPTALLISYLWHLGFGHTVVTTEKANHLLSEINPITSLSLFYAAIAGVYLFLSGLIAGYYDNKAVYRRIAERIGAHPLLNRVFGEYKSRRFGQYIGENLGGLAGNFYLGMFLGLTGSIGIILGLPLDIRHVAFASANLAFGSSTLGFDLPTATWVYSIVGVILIAMINLGVSFSLALWVAIRSRKLKMSDAVGVAPILFKHFLHKPWQFFLPLQDKEKESSKNVSEAPNEEIIAEEIAEQVIAADTAEVVVEEKGVVETKNEN